MMSIRMACGHVYAGDTTQEEEETVILEPLDEPAPGPEIPAGPDTVPTPSREPVPA